MSFSFRNLKIAVSESDLSPFDGNKLAPYYMGLKNNCQNVTVLLGIPLANYMRYVFSNNRLYLQHQQVHDAYQLTN